MPTERNPAVLAMVEEELKDDRTLKNEYLYERAVAIDRAIADLTPLQFHGRYALPVRRRLSRADGRNTQSGRKNAEPVASAAPSATAEFPPTQRVKLSPFLDDREPSPDTSANGTVETVAENGATNGNGVEHHEEPGRNRLGRTGVRRRLAQARARIEGPKLEFDEQALRTTLIRIMRDVAEASEKGASKVVEVVARVEKYMSEVKETARLLNVQ